MTIENLFELAKEMHIEKYELNARNRYSAIGEVENDCLKVNKDIQVVLINDAI